MKKQKRQILILIILLAILGAAFFLIRVRNQKEAEKPQEEDTAQVKILELVSDDIVALSYDCDGETYSFEKKDDVWYLVGEPDRNLTQTTVKAFAMQFCPMEASQVIQSVTDVSQYGFSEESVRKVSASTADATYTILVGDENELTDSYYVMLPDSQDVYVVDSYVISRFDRTPDSYTVVEESEESIESETSEDGQTEEVEESLEDDLSNESDFEESSSD